MLNLMVHTVTTLSFTELKKFLCITFTENTKNPKPNVLSVRPMCKLLLLLVPLLLLLLWSFNNAVQISVSTTNVINRTHARTHATPATLCHKTNTDGHCTNSSAIYHTHFIASHHLSHVNGKSTVRPITGNDDAEGKWRYSFTLSLISALDGGEWLTPDPDHLPPGKNPVPIVQEAGWASQSFWTAGVNLAPAGAPTPDHPRLVGMFQRSLLRII